MGAIGGFFYNLYNGFAWNEIAIPEDGFAQNVLRQQVANQTLAEAEAEAVLRNAIEFVPRNAFVYAALGAVLRQQANRLEDPQT